MPFEVTNEMFIYFLSYILDIIFFYLVRKYIHAYL